MVKNKTRFFNYLLIITKILNNFKNPPSTMQVQVRSYKERLFSSLLVITNIRNNLEIPTSTMQVQVRSYKHCSVNLSTSHESRFSSLSNSHSLTAYSVSLILSPDTRKSVASPLRFQARDKQFRPKNIEVMLVGDKQ